MDANELASAFAIEVALARRAAELLQGSERTHAANAIRYAKQLSERLPNRPMRAGSTTIVGGENWRNCCLAIQAALAQGNRRLYSRCLELVAAEITDDDRLDDLKCEQLILRGTAHLAHLARSGKKREELVKG